MSAPSSPHIGHSTTRIILNNKGDQPEGLDILNEDKKTTSDGEVLHEREYLSVDKSAEQHFNFNVSMTDEPPTDHEPQPISRSTSTTSSLDPYYFGIQSENESQSPLPPLPPVHIYLSTTPDHPPLNEPVTPVRNPAMIDRRGLVGVGELTTPRWAKEEPTHELESTSDIEGYDVIVPENVEEEDQPDSPWTIEAIDGESSDKEEVSSEIEPLPQRSLRTRPSIADESGGEEILYPRSGIHFDTSQLNNEVLSKLEDISKGSHPLDPPHLLDTDFSKSPPSSFNPSARTARKRSSDEFEMDQTGSLVSKHVRSISASKEKPKDDKPTTRKHRSLNISVASPRDTKGKEGRRDSVGLTINNNTKVPPLSGALHDKHVRQTSASSTSSNTMETIHNRRVHTTDFSRLPPSPSSSSIQQFLRNATAPSASQSSSSIHRSSRDNLSSTNVAHSILRGNQQEGWTPDEESIRKMDGVTGKTARARSSVGSLASSSRPGTPGSKSGSHWEGISTDSGKSKRGSGNVKERPDFTRMASTGGTSDTANIGDTSFTAISSDEQSPNPLILDKTPKKSGAGARLSFTPKRGSTSSTTYTGTPSSRDSASMSATTSMTSISATSGRHSMSKGRRNSAGSDISSVHSTEGGALKDRGGSVGGGDVSEEGNVPPVPPLPKDLSNYRSPPSTSSGLTFPSVPSEDKAFQNEHQSRTAPLDVPQYSSPIISPPTSSSGRRESQYYSSANETSPLVVKTPSKKWSFSSALNLKLGSPSSSSQKSSFPLSPRAVTFGQQLRKSTSKEQATTMASSSANVKVSWSPSQPDAMASAGSLTSLSSVGSVRTSGQININSAKTPDRPPFSSRSDAESTDYNSAALSAPPGPLSPSSSIRRAQPKRLTPSSIPFFRRSSSQSMQLPPPNGTYLSSSPPYPGITSTNPLKSSVSPSHDLNSVSTSTPGTTHKKTSMFSLLKSSSRRSLHSDAKDSGKESQKAKETVTRESDKEKAKLEKDQRKKDDKDRSESRISVIINRKRGKTLSSADPRKPKSPINLPPMQISALEPATAHRVAKLKSANATPVGSSSRTSTSSTSSRLTSQTVSSMQKQSDTSLRSRNQLPTIAGSPSVGTTGTNSSQTLKDHREPALSSLANSASGLPKETPTKIPRISSRTSAAPSPATRRASGLAVSSSTNASPTSMTTNEFGVIENEDGTIPRVRHPSNTVQASPAASTSRVPRQSMGPPTSNATVNSSARKNRESFMGLRKSSTNSVASLSTSATANESSASASTSHHRFSMLSPSKGLKLLAPKSTPKSSSSAVPPTAGSPSSSRQSLSTPSPVPSTVDEDELLGDEEMLHYIRRQHAKKLAAGATQEELDEMLKFPEPEPPTPPSTPAAILKSHQNQYLSEFEKKEILDYPSVYCIGANSKKKMAVLDNSTNNYGYDDERGDYLIVNHDHLAYRYEIIDTLGKGSFGQVLNCRDHVTGEAVAIKIIRNKKRFHHQALVEIKILDSLRKWDADEKHHVIKMNEHFYFRNHLCIAMELLSINLYELIKANGFVGFTTALIRRFTSQMLLSLSLMRHHRIVHCDLKPENVLLRHPAKSGIKVIDFGSSCFEHEKIYTYIQSRFYRSPEVILGMNYHMAIDMWSLGCILAELYTGFPIFPGENEQEQLSCIMEVLGVPDKEFINRSSRRKLFFDTNGAPRAVVNSKGRRRRPGTKTLAQVLRCNDEEFVDFVSKCLIWDPERRIKPQAALRHPFVTSGRRAKTATTVTKSTPSSSSLSSRTKQVLETPKKSLISAPTPLTARSSRTIANGGLITPNNSHSQLQASTSMQASTRTYRTSQTQSLSSFNSSRTLTGYISNTNK